MEFNEIVQSELNQTTIDLLLQQTIQTNQKMQEVQDTLTLIQDLKTILPESIENVLYEQLQRLLDSQENSQKLNKEELQNNKQQHDLQMSQINKEFNKKVEEFQRETEIQLKKLQDQNQTIILGNCKDLFSSSEKSLSEKINKCTVNLQSTIKKTKKMMGKNLIFNFLATLVLIAFLFVGVHYVYNYKDGTKIAEAKAVEALANERDKIEKNAVSEYKKSDLYKEDACKFVASNISKIDCLYYMYIYIRADDIKKYKEVSSFYNDYLKKGYNKYTKKK